MENKDKIYVSPQVETFEIEIEQGVLNCSNLDPQNGNWD